MTSPGYQQEHGWLKGGCTEEKPTPACVTTHESRNPCSSLNNSQAAPPERVSSLRNCCCLFKLGEGPYESCHFLNFLELLCFMSFLSLMRLPPLSWKEWFSWEEMMMPHHSLHPTPSLGQTNWNVLQTVAYSWEGLSNVEPSLWQYSKHLM